MEQKQCEKIFSIFMLHDKYFNYINNIIIINTSPFCAFMDIVSII